MAKKALIISASAGSGHIRAAQAIENAFAKHAPGIEVRHIDALAYTPKLFAGMYAKSYLAMANRLPALWGYLYGEYDKKRLDGKSAKLRKFIDRLNTRKLVDYIRDFTPDHIIMTHFLPAEVMSGLKKKHRLDIDCSLVVTDFDVHAFWIHGCMERYFVPSREVAYVLARRKIDEPAVHTVGIPIDPVFGRREKALALKQSMGIGAKKKVILIASGGFGVGNVQETVRRLAACVKGAEFLVVCGRNAKMKKAVGAVQPPGGNRIHAFGFVDNMHELMSVSDVIVTKAGGLTVSEALAKHLPIIILSPIPGQEERNSDYLLEEGAAVKVNSLPALEYKLRELVKNRTKLKTMKENAKRIAKPRAAADVVKIVLG